MAEKKKVFGLLKRIVLTLILGYILGFAAFAALLPKVPRHVGQVDGVVALTGGGERLDVAVALFEQGKGKRLLISGVNTQTTKRELKKLSHGKQRFDCCTDLGYAAENTFGNAKEAAAWARFHRYKSILLVTARYHMPRSVAEFHDVMPDVAVIAYPVDADVGKGFAARMHALKLLHSEYAKFIAVTILTATGLEPGLDPDAPAAESARAS